MSSASSLPPSSHSTSQARGHSLPPTNSSNSSSNQLYALASRVPLIKSHSISLPKPVKLPPDLHPLPTDISAYFVYPFSLESYVLDPNTPSSATIDQLLDKHKQYLEAREREKEEKKKEMLRKVAPGWQGTGGAMLMPTSAAGAGAKESVQTEAAPAVETNKAEQQTQQERTPLDDLADHLAQLDALNSSSTSTGAPPPPTTH